MIVITHILIFINLISFISNECSEFSTTHIHVKPNFCLNIELTENEKKEADSCCHLKYLFMGQPTSFCIAIKKEEKELYKKTYSDVYNSEVNIVCSEEELEDIEEPGQNNKCSYMFPYSEKSCFKMELSDEEKKVDYYGFNPNKCCYYKYSFGEKGLIDNCIPIEESKINIYYQKLNEGLNKIMKVTDLSVICSDSDKDKKGEQEEDSSSSEDESKTPDQKSHSISSFIHNLLYTYIIYITFIL